MVFRTWMSRLLIHMSGLLSYIGVGVPRYFSSLSLDVSFHVISLTSTRLYLTFFKYELYNVPSKICRIRKFTNSKTLFSILLLQNKANIVFNILKYIWNKNNLSKILFKKHETIICIYIYNKTLNWPIRDRNNWFFISGSHLKFALIKRIFVHGKPKHAYIILKTKSYIILKEVNK